MTVTRQDVIHNYGKSVYAVRLELAMQFYVQGKTPKESFELADEFLSYLKTQEKE